MFNKNLKYYRLKNNMSKKDLASQIGVTPMAVTNYENGDRKPDMQTIKLMAKVLNVRVADFLNTRNSNLAFAHGEFRKGSKFGIHQQEYVRESVEEYLGRFYSVLDILGGEVLADAPGLHNLPLTGEVEQNARLMREYMGVAVSGPIGNLIELLENRGVLVFAMDLDNDAFSGMNGSVNGRPYVIYNKNMSPERVRSTIAHEMAHFIFSWPEEMEDKNIEKMATAISGAFLFPQQDVVRELGIRRTKITKDMILTCKEYGISMYLLVKRARLSEVISESVEKEFYILAGQLGWKKKEPVRISAEEPMLFDQLVFRAVSEEEISVQKGAELLKKPYIFVEEHCFAAGV